MAVLSLLAAGWLVLGLGIAASAEAADPAPARLAVPAVPAAPGDGATALAGDQIKALGTQVQAMLTVARRQQDELAQLRHRLADAEAAEAWLPWLVLALAALGAVAVWLGLRTRRLQRELRLRSRARAEHPSRSAGAADAATAAVRTVALADRSLLAPAGAGAQQAAADNAGIAPPASDRAPAQPAAVQATVSRDLSLGTGVPPRPVSVEELLDLEQQVEFFLVLGQSQEAVDLLLSHVRGTGGTSALPYFKLLEIYRQHGDEEAYERTRERFNQRFNAWAPAWGGDLAGGRTLEDYPEVLARLQRAWPQPMRAVAELEAMLLRRADLEPFDMPAYRDVLMLHALVLDLPAAAVAAITAEPSPLPASPPSAARADDAVDLLLPLGEGPLEITSPRPHLSERISAQAMLAEWVFSRGSSPLPQDPPPPSRQVDELLDLPDLGEPDFVHSSRPGLLDLDLSDFAPAPREFTRPAAFTDIDMRRDSRLSDLAFDNPDAEPPPGPARR